MPAPGLGVSEATRALRPTVSDMIWNLHCIIANPNSKPDEVRTARRRLLRLLKTSKFQKMIVPPLALPAEPTDGATAATKRLDSTELCELCGRPVSREVAKARTRVSPSGRASSSAKVRTTSFDHEARRRSLRRSPHKSPNHADRRPTGSRNFRRSSFCLEYNHTLARWKSLARPAPTDSAKRVRFFQLGI